MSSAQNRPASVNCGTPPCQIAYAAIRIAATPNPAAQVTTSGRRSFHAQVAKTTAPASASHQVPPSTVLVKKREAEQHRRHGHDGE